MSALPNRPAHSGRVIINLFIFFKMFHQITKSGETLASVSQQTLHLINLIVACDDLADALITATQEDCPLATADQFEFTQQQIDFFNSHIDEIRSTIASWVGKSISNSLSQSNHSLI